MALQSTLLSTCSPCSRKIKGNAIEHWNTSELQFVHQGSVYEASAAAAPFLIQILAQVPDEQKPPIPGLLDGLAIRHWYAGRDLARLKIVNMSRQRWQSSGQFLREGNQYHHPEWMELSHAAVSKGIPVFLSLLQSTNQETVCRTFTLLSAFQELSQAITPALMAFISEVDDPTLKALALRCLGDLLTEQAPEWEEYKRLIALSSDQIPSSVHFAAAETFAKYHPSEATSEIIDILVENMLKPYSLDLHVLSLLGMPKGWQALISLLERGAANWILLDTIRVAEAILDMAFFGAWVEGRFWNYRSKRYGPALLKAVELAGGEPPGSPEIENIPDLSEGVATFRFQYGISNSYPPRPDDLLIRVWGYGKDEAKKLSQRFEQEGAQALSADQKEALRVVLRCEPLWQYRHNLMEILACPSRNMS